MTAPAKTPAAVDTASFELGRLFGQVEQRLATLERSTADLRQRASSKRHAPGLASGLGSQLNLGALAARVVLDDATFTQAYGRMSDQMSALHRDGSLHDGDDASKNGSLGEHELAESDECRVATLPAVEDRLQHLAELAHRLGEGVRECRELLGVIHDLAPSVGPEASVGPADGGVL